MYYLLAAMAGAAIGWLACALLSGSKDYDDDFDHRGTIQALQCALAKEQERSERYLSEIRDLEEKVHGLKSKCGKLSRAVSMVPWKEYVNQERRATP